MKHFRHPPVRYFKSGLTQLAQSDCAERSAFGNRQLIVHNAGAVKKTITYGSQIPRQEQAIVL